MRETDQEYLDILETCRKSRSKAMRYLCFRCTCFDREAIKACTDKFCPLWTWRPGAKSKIRDPNRPKRTMNPKAREALANYRKQKREEKDAA